MISPRTSICASAAALCALSFATATLPADAGSGKACVEAVVIADVVDQLYIEPTKAPPGYIPIDGLFRDSLKVKRVMSGPVERGPLAVNAVAHTYMSKEWARNRRFKLLRDQHGEWWIESGT